MSLELEEDELDDEEEIVRWKNKKDNRKVGKPRKF
jgi:hypothetical protein